MPCPTKEKFSSDKQNKVNSISFNKKHTASDMSQWSLEQLHKQYKSWDPYLALENSWASWQQCLKGRYVDVYIP